MCAFALLVGACVDLDVPTACSQDPNVCEGVDADSTTGDSGADGARADSAADGGIDTKDGTIATDAAEGGIDTALASDSTPKDSAVDASETDSGTESGIDTALPDTRICTPGSYVCEGAAGNELKQCASDGSAYVLAAMCPSAATCSSSLGLCTACTPGAVSCAGAQLMKCDASGATSSALGALCPTGTICDPKGAGQCDVCVENAIYCTGSTLKKCAADGQSFSTLEVCATPELCATSSASGCTPPTCAAGEIKCVGSDLQRCNAGRTAFEAVSTCATPELCAITATGCAAPACAVGEKKCSGNFPQTCNAGRTGWVDGTACTAPTTCGGGGTTGVCGCTPNPSACTGKNCGSVDNGCGTLVSCGTCSSPQTCAGSGTPNVCGGCAAVMPGPAMASFAGYCIDKTEVTQSQYQAFVTATGSTPSGDPSYCSFNTSYLPSTLGSCAGWSFDPVALANRPIACIDWCDANAYCRWAGKRLCGRIGGGRAELSVDPLSSSQWYMACSNAGSSAYPYGATHVGGACNDSSSAAADVSSFSSCHAPSGALAAVYDLTGNVSEWEDFWLSGRFDGSAAA
jgi:sulfatase modifying factor 1